MPESIRASTYIWWQRLKAYDLSRLYPQNVDFTTLLKYYLQRFKFMVNEDFGYDMVKQDSGGWQAGLQSLILGQLEALVF